MVRGCIATSRCRRRKLPSDGWWPIVVAGGGGVVSLTCILEASRRVFNII